ncbi:MAG: efflux RND transporter periplasmic adaptor subunit [Planctomycetes bacterium]|nr:efflux RND transporter periplasmic adaptor subunit [Planctomycetota bacterium]
MRDEPSDGMNMPPDGIDPLNEGGLRPPPGLGFWGRTWWWFHFLVLVKIARFRFIAILLVIGLVILKWDLFVAYYAKWTRPAAEQSAASSDTEYFCPMHPAVIRDNPKEKCPICFMPLSKRKKGDAKDEALPAGIVNRLQLSPYRVVLAGIETWKVQHVPLYKEISTIGFVEFNERELKHVAARVKARIAKLYVNETGQWVSADQELASLYSPDLSVTVGNLIDANRNRNQSLEDSTRDRLRLWGINDKQMDLVIAVQNLIDGMRTADKKLHDLAHQQLLKLDNGEKFGGALHNLLEGQRTKNAELQKDSRQKLVKLGMHEDQIDDIMETGKAIRHLIIRSPIKGHVLKKYIKEGQYVDEGSPLYDVVDLTTVWIQAQVYEDDMAFLPTFHQPLAKGVDSPKALRVTATTRALPNETFQGRLSFVYPHVDQDTRTVVARFELDNTGHKLRPGTTANVKFKIPPKQLPLIARALANAWWQHTAVDGLRSVYSPGGLGAGLGPLVQAAGNRALLLDGRVLSVPETAVIDTGSQKIVYREIEAGMFEGVKVELGPRLAGPGDSTFYPVLHGLDPGDVIVTAGSFLVDAETRLNPAAGSIYFGGSGGSKSGSSVTSVRPSTPADEDAKVKAALEKLSDADRKLAEAQVTCPILEGSRLGSMGVPIKLMLEGQPVLLCCIGCQGKAKAKAKETVKLVEELTAKALKRERSKVSPKRLDPEAEIQAELTKLGAEDRRLAVEQRLCPMSGQRLGSMGVPTKHMIQGQAVFLCCAACDAPALENPAKTLAKVNELRAKNKTLKK